jgi:hypothetical protein
MVTRHAARLFGDDLPDELTAQLVFNLSLTDIGVDSVQVAAQMLATCLDYLDLYNPRMILENKRWELERDPDADLDIPTARDRVEELLGARWGHKLWRVLALYWLESAYSLAEEWDGSALKFFREGGSAKEMLATLLSTENGTLLVNERRKRYPGFGQKTARVLLARVANAGLAEVRGLCEVGPPVDIHATLLSVGCGLIGLDGPTPAGTVINALHALWQETSDRHELEVVRLYEAIWMWGRRMCRKANCRHCPMWVSGGKQGRGTPSCLGRIATTSYYGGDRGVRRIDPTTMVDVGVQLELQLGLIPEAAGSGLYEPDYPLQILMAQLMRPENNPQMSLPGMS